MIDAESIQKNKLYYEEDEDFKEFVDKYATKFKISIDVAFTHRQVTVTREYYEDCKK